MKHRCPICQKVVKTPPFEQSTESKLFPFCSLRCKLVDLGAWLDADYRITSESKSQQKNDINHTSVDPLTEK